MRDPLAIVPAVDDIQERLETEEKELEDIRQRDVQKNTEQDAVEKKSQTYKVLWISTDVLHGVVDDVITWGLLPEVHARLVDALRLCDKAKRADAPRTRKTTVVEFFRKKSLKALNVWHVWESSKITPVSGISRYFKTQW